MKYYGAINDGKDLVTKEYVDSHTGSDPRLTTTNVGELEVGYNTQYGTYNIDIVDTGGDSVSINNLGNPSSNPVVSLLPDHDYSQHQDLGTLAYLSDVPTKTSDLTNDSGYITGSYLPLTGGTLSGGLKVNSHTTEIGTIVSSTAITTSVASSTTAGTSVKSISLPAGKWILLGEVRFPSNTTGYRRVAINTTKNSNAYNAQYAGQAGGATHINVTSILSTTSTSTTVYLTAGQNSGSAMTVSNVLFEAIRIA